MVSGSQLQVAKLAQMRPAAPSSTQWHPAAAGSAQRQPAATRVKTQVKAAYNVWIILEFFPSELSFPTWMT